MSKPSRLIDPAAIKVERADYHPYLAGSWRANQSQALYVLIDYFQLSWPTPLCGVLVTDASPDLLQVPNVEPLLCLIPSPLDPMVGFTRPSVIFWQDSFWIPLLDLTPAKHDLGRMVYGHHNFGFDVLAPADVSYAVEMGDIDELCRLAAEKMQQHRSGGEQDSELVRHHNEGFNLDRWNLSRRKTSDSTR